MIKEGYKNMKIKNEYNNVSMKVYLNTTLSLLITTLFIGAICINTSIASADTTDTISINVQAACTMNATDTTHSSNVTPGQWTEGIGQTNITATCNDPGGYAIYAIGYSNNEYGNTNLINTTDSTKTIITGPNKSGNTSNWSMKLGHGTGESATIEGETQGDTEDFYTDYHAIPVNYTKVATKTSATDPTITGTAMTTTYGVFTTAAQVAGTYTGQVKYTLVHPNTAPAPISPVATDPGYISYNPNAAGVTDSMGDQSIGATDTTAELWASNFQRPGYGFAGWTDKFDWVLNENDANGNGTGANAGYHIYGPNETITFTAGQYSGDNPGLSLYAVWVPSEGNLQSWTGCSSMPQGQVTALTDQRDNDTYAIAKLKDDNCWMIENLRLDNTAEHNSDGTLAQGYNSSFIGLASPETANFSSPIAANSLYSTDGTTSATISGSNAGYRFPRYNNQNTSSPATNMTAWDNNSNTYSVGNWYTWHAAIADTTHYSTNNQTTSNTSICPSGWKLPSGGSSANATNSDFWKLGTGIMGFAPSNNSAYQSSETNAQGETGTQAFRSYPNNFLYSGYFYGSSANNRGSYGRYWSSTTYDDVNSYLLRLYSSNVYPGTNNSYKFSGLSIRCISGS